MARRFYIVGLKVLGTWLVRCVGFSCTAKCWLKLG